MRTSYRLAALALGIFPLLLTADPTPTPVSTQIPDLPIISDSKNPTPSASPTHSSDTVALPPIDQSTSPTPAPVLTSSPTLTPPPSPRPSPAMTPTPSSASEVITPVPTPTPHTVYINGTPTPEPEHLLNENTRWFLEYIRGKTYGFVKITSGQKGTLFITKREEQTLIRREGYTFHSSSDLEEEEDVKGTVVSFDFKGTNLEGNQALSGVRNGDQIIIHSPAQADLSVTVPVGSCVGPYDAEREETDLRLQAGEKLALPLFSLEHLKTPDQVSYEVGAKTSHTLADGTAQDLWPITEIHEGSKQPKSVRWFNDKHEVVAEQDTIPGIGELDLNASSREECGKPLDGLELYASTMIRPDRSLNDQSLLGQATYDLICPGLPTDLPVWKDDVYTQEVKTSKPGEAKVTVWMGAFAPESASYELPMTSPPPELVQYLKPSHYLESDSPEIKSLAYQAGGGIKNPVVVARRIETFVRGYITKGDLQMGFVTARTTAHTCEGDCKEHAVLCAAMGRALGMPTRCVVGLCYVPPTQELFANVSGDVSHGVFSFHMWAEAYIAPGIWMPMDAATYGYDAGHIALVKTALDEDNPDFESPISPMVGKLMIHILSTDLTNRPLPLPKPVEDTEAVTPKQLD